jgi:hypothetical protein
VSPVRYELGFYVPEDGVRHSHRRKNLTSYEKNYVQIFGEEILFSIKNSVSPIADGLYLACTKL